MTMMIYYSINFVYWISWGKFWDNVLNFQILYFKRHVDQSILLHDDNHTAYILTSFTGMLYINLYPLSSLLNCCLLKSNFRYALHFPLSRVYAVGTCPGTLSLEPSLGLLFTVEVISYKIITQYFLKYENSYLASPRHFSLLNSNSIIKSFT